MQRRALLFLSTLALAAGTATASAAPVVGGGGCHADITGARHTDGTTSVVRMDICSFEPTVARVPVGAEVTFLNTSAGDHLVTGRGNTWGSELLAPGQSIARAFPASGVFPYSCPLHPGMVGVIVVGEELIDAAQAVSSVTAPGTGIDPFLAAGLGALSALAVLVAGLAMRRGRPAQEG